MVLGQILTLWHVLEEVVASKVNIVDDLAQVFVEVGACQGNEVVQSLLGNVSLPLQLACWIFFCVIS